MENENVGTCEVCEEMYDLTSEYDSYLAAEWWVNNKSVMAHYECGINQGWERA